MLSAQMCELMWELEAEKRECLSKLENITSGMYTAYPSLYDNFMHVKTVWFIYIGDIRCKKNILLNYL